MKPAESMTSESGFSRRQLLRALGGGILVLVVGPAAFADSVEQREGQPSVSQQLGAWVHISEAGLVTVFTGKVEVGQNARTNITQAVAEELRLHPDSINIVMGDTDLVPFDMGTFGSMTTPQMLPQVRRAATSALDFLLDIASQKSGINRAKLHVADGRISFGSFAATYGDLAKGQSLDRAISAEAHLTEAVNWKVMGTSVKKIGAEHIVTGKHKYTSDLSRPGMLHAKILRPHSFGATLSSLDTKAAEALEGVKVVHDGDFVAVAAPTLSLANKALSAMDAQWTETSHPARADLFPLLRGSENTPSVARGTKTLAGTYRCNFIAHVPLEPRAALAEWDGQRMTVHTGTQRPFAVRDEVARATGLTTQQVRVIVPDTGSGYGGKHEGDAAVEAARISKALGKPIRLVWTRKEEMTWSYFRPAGVVEISSGLGPNGLVSDWTHDNYNSGPSGIETPYNVGQKRDAFHRANSPLRQGSYRSLASCFNTFARETHMDELAHMIGKDPLQFRLENLKNERLRAVLQAVANNIGWPGKPSNGHGFGIACGTDKGGYVATAVQLSVEGTEVSLLRAVTAYDCGAIVNPDLLKNQVVGGMIMGIGGALFEIIDFAYGRVLNDRLSKYRVPRFTDIPEIDCVLIDRNDIPSAGAGETPIIAIAPAIGNAIFMATGRRLRELPLTLS